MALIDNEEIEIDKIPIILLSDVFDGVVQGFADRLQDFEKIAEATRLFGFPHEVETKSAQLNLQMELVELRNNEQFVKKFKDQENPWKYVHLF